MDGFYMNKVNRSDKTLVNVKILLTEEQRGSFPVGVESLWFKPIGANYQLKNAPFFIDGLSYDDIVSLRLVDEDTYQVGEILEHSLNSTVWVYLKESSAGLRVIERLTSFHCDLETGVIDDYYAVNVPGGSDYIAITELLDSAEDLGHILVSYASVRC
jgi:hypothetical protein